MSTEIDNQEQNDEDESLASEIRELLAQGHSVKDIIGLGYAPSTTRQEARKWAKQHGGADTEAKAPVSLTIKDKEQVLPEWLEGQVATIFDGSLAQQRAFQAGMAVPLLGLRLFSESMKPFGELMKLWQLGQAAAAKEAQGSGAEIARETLNEFLPPVLDMVKQASIAQSPNPMQAMMVRMVEPMISSIMGKFTGQTTGQGSLPPGWKDNRTEK